MASIQKRGKKYAVVYTYTDSADVKRQKWETYGTKKEAAARKAQVENEMNNGTFIPPSSALASGRVFAGCRCAALPRQILLNSTVQSGGGFQPTLETPGSSTITSIQSLAI